MGVYGKIRNPCCAQYANSPHYRQNEEIWIFTLAPTTLQGSSDAKKISSITNMVDSLAVSSFVLEGEGEEDD